MAFFSTGGFCSPRREPRAAISATRVVRLLIAFREVESSLAALRILDQQHESQLRAVVSAERAEQLATSRYKTGLTNVLELVDAQRTRLQVERVRLSVRQQQMLASVALIRALGGGWEGRQDANGQQNSMLPVSQKPGS